jgi:hypothetical protein
VSEQQLTKDLKRFEHLLAKLVFSKTIANIITGINPVEFDIVNKTITSTVPKVIPQNVLDGFNELCELYPSYLEACEMFGVEPSKELVI